MILRVCYEEVTALNSAAERVLATVGAGGVVAPPEALAELEGRLPLRGDVSVETLAQQRRLMGALEHVLEHLRRRMDALIVEQYVGSDDAVNAYFDYANVLTIRSRLRDVGREMAAMLEVMGGAASPESDEEITFPD